MEMIRDFANDSLDIWSEPIRARSKRGCAGFGFDVLLSTNNISNKATGTVTPRITATFYGKAREIVSGYARVKISSLYKVKDRIYFALYATDDPALGYKTPDVEKSSSHDSYRVCFTVDTEQAEAVEREYKGYYNLEFDERYQLYFIDLNDRKRIKK